MDTAMRARFSLAALLLLAACTAPSGPPSGDAPLPGDAGDSRPFAAIPATALIRFAGTEPFWGGTVAGGELLWSTPDNPPGERIAVARFAGRGGLSFSGTLAGQPLVLAVTPGSCSDGMSERNYPYAATVTLGAEVLDGCAWLAGDDLGPPP